jgi:hypothetical protein
VTGSRAWADGPAAWLTVQAVLFGAWAAVLGVVANAMFLEAFGAGWLPVTYIAIGVAGVAVSAAVRRGAERFDLLRLAVGILGGAAMLTAVAWTVASNGDGAWVSGPLLVAFPVLIQLGFVFIGGQAGRVLNIAGIKASFPRIMTGFPIGAAIGGLVAVPLVDRLGRVENLLLVAAIVQIGFAAAVWATSRRFSREMASTAPSPPTASTDSVDAADDPTLRGLLRRPIVVLVLSYQVLSALGSQVADFLVFDRASALFATAEGLGRFVAGYTALMNGVAIVFLFLVAGPLMRRYGLRLGIGANPIVDLLMAVAILVALVAAGPASVGLLGVVAAARIADIALTDGLTRTSINALYQVLPARQRLVTQATVEGMGVPMAIGASGVLILVLDAVPGALALRVVVLGIVCAAWAWVGARLYREYGPALGVALRGRRLLDVAAPIDASLEDVVLLGTLAMGPNTRVSRLARDLVSLVPSPIPAADVAPMGPRALPARDVRALARLLEDPAPETRAAALDSVRAGDAFAVRPAVRALLDGGTAPPAAAALARLGDAAVPALRDALAAARSGGDGDGHDAAASGLVVAARLVRAVRTASPERDAVLASNVDHPNRALGLLVMERLGGARPALAGVATAFDRARGEDLDHATRILAAHVVLSDEPELDPDGVVRRALQDELELVGRRIAARLEGRFGRDEMRAVLARLQRDAASSALAAEALEVTLGREAAAQVVAVLTPGLPTAERQRPLAPRSVVASARDGRQWLLDIAADEAGLWRSAWLRACAIRAARLTGALRSGRSPGAELGRAEDVDGTVAEELALAGLG